MAQNMQAVPGRRAGDFWIFWTGQTISQIGSALTSTALPLLVFLHKRLSYGMLLLGSILLAGVCVLALIATQLYWVDLVCFGVMFGLIGLFDVAFTSILQAIAPNQLLGRVLTFTSVLAIFSVPLLRPAWGTKLNTRLFLRKCLLVPVVKKDKQNWRLKTSQEPKKRTQHIQAVQEK